jgi:hypothetical protein
LDPQDPNSIAIGVRTSSTEVGTRYAHIEHLPPLGEHDGPEGAVTILGSP